MSIHPQKNVLKSNDAISRYKHIIWDWNGTLFDDLWLSIKVINILLKEHGLKEINETKYKQIFDFPVINYYKKLGFDFQKTSFDIVGTKFIKLYTKQWQKCQLHNGALKILNEFSARGYRQSILSAANVDLLKTWVEYYQIGGYFQYIIGLNHHFASSKSEIGKTLLEQIHVPKDNVLLIGDTAHDYQVSRKLGIDCWLVSCGHHSSVKLQSLQAPVYRSLNELMRFFS